MDLRALGALATGFLKGQMASRETKRAAEVQALQEFRQQQQIEAQRAQVDTQNSQWQKTFDAQAAANKSAEDFRTKTWDYEHGTGPGSKSALEAAAAEKALSDRVIMLEGKTGLTGRDLYPDAKLKAYQEEVTSQALSQVSSQVGAASPMALTHPEEDPLTAQLAPAVTQAALAQVAGKRQAPVVDRQLSQGNVEIRQDQPFAAMSHDEKVAQLALAQRRAQPGTELSVGPNGYALGMKTPTDQEKMQTDTGNYALETAKDEAPLRKRELFATVVVKEAQADIAKATTAAEIGAVKSKWDLTKAQVLETLHRGSYTAAQERGLMRDLKRADAELAEKIKEGERRFAIDKGQLGVAQTNAETSRMSVAAQNRLGLLNFHLNEAETRTKLAGRVDGLTVQQRADQGVSSQRELSTFYHNARLGSQLGSQAATQGKTVPTFDELRARIEQVRVLTAQGSFSKTQGQANMAALQQIAEEAGYPIDIDPETGNTVPGQPAALPAPGSAPAPNGGGTPGMARPRKAR